jgi:pimeloyl-ACP methyl ester carboxylesterase
MAATAEPRELRVAVEGGELCAFEWGVATESAAAGRSPTILLTHATGFHARVWDATVRALGDGWHVIAVDQRGHGRSLKRGPFSWERFGQDLVQFIEALDLRAIVGVGHSMGGHATVQAAAALPQRFERLVLVDPVIMDPAFYRHHPGVPGTTRPEDHPTAKRKNAWTSWREMYERFEHRGTFALWRRDVLADYCRYGVLPNPDGPGFVLACPPLVEAAIYTQSAGRDISALFARIEVPVTVLRAQRREGPRQDVMDFAASPTWPHLAAQFAKGRDVHLPQLTHFIPMQAPEVVARCILDADADV